MFLPAVKRSFLDVDGFDIFGLLLLRDREVAKCNIAATTCNLLRYILLYFVRGSLWWQSLKIAFQKQKEWGFLRMKNLWRRSSGRNPRSIPTKFALLIITSKLNIPICARPCVFSSYAGVSIMIMFLIKQASNVWRLLKARTAELHHLIFKGTKVAFECLRSNKGDNFEKEEKAEVLTNSDERLRSKGKCGFRVFAPWTLLAYAT